MLNGFRAEGNLNNFNAPPVPYNMATGGTVTLYPASPRTNLVKNPLANTAQVTDVFVSGGVANFATGPAGGSPYQISMYSYANSGITTAYYYFNLSSLTAGTQYCISFYLNFPYIRYSVFNGYDFMGNPVYSYTNNSYVNVVYQEGSSISTLTTLNYTGGTRSKISAVFTYNGGAKPKIGFLFTFNNNMNSIYNITLDNLIVETGTSTGDYFSGSSTECHWNGDIGASSSSQNQYKIHTFTAEGYSTFDISSVGATFNTLQYLIVAGGGAGGGYGGGGGGAGGLLYGSMTAVKGSYPVKVGGGGVGAVYPNIGSSGSNSMALGLTAMGGGAGGTPNLNDPYYVNNTGKNGGSGGGSSYPYGYLAGGTGTTGQGNNGGACMPY